MNIKQLIPILIWSFLINWSCLAQKKDNNLDKKHSIAHLKEDFQILRSSIEKTHPELYLYTSKHCIDSVFNIIDSSLNRPMTSIEFFREISILHKYIKNSHTSFAPDEIYEQAIQADLLQFPFDVYWDNNALYTLKNASSDDNIEDGSLIESINGEPAEALFRELVGYMFRDGDNSTGPELYVMRKFNLYYSYFKGNPSSFQLKIISPEGVKKTVSVPSINLNEMKANKLMRYNKEDKHWSETQEPVLLLEIKDEVAFMTIKTFSNGYIKNAHQRFKKFMKESFATIKSSGTKHLVVDLRNNGGGDDGNIVEMFSRVYQKQFILYNNISTSFKRIPNRKLYEDKSFSDLFIPLTLKKAKKGYQVNRLGNEGLLNPNKPARNVYDGGVYVLTNGNSYSASGFTTSLFRNYNRGIIIGEEPGGNPKQCAAGILKTLRLPNTGTKIVMPLRFIEMNIHTENTGHGVIPDYEIRPNIDDVLQEKDVVMDFTIDLIKGNKT